MRTLVFVLGFLFLFAGAVWILQGVNLLPGSFMSGSSRWALIGLVTAVVGLGLVLFAGRRGRGSD